MKAVTKRHHNFLNSCCHLAKTNFWPTGHHLPRCILLPWVCTVPSDSGIFKMHPGNRVLWWCAAPLAILPRSPQLCENGGLSVLSSIGETEKTTVGKDRQACCFWPMRPWWRRNYKKVRCHDATAGSFVVEVWAEVFAQFHTVGLKRHSSMRNWLFGLPGRILCRQSLDVKENYDHVFYIALRMSSLFRSLWVWSFHVRLMLSSQNACLITTRASLTLFPPPPRFVQILMHTRCRIHREVADTFFISLYYLQSV
jgi:hypothetical protein